MKIGIASDHRGFKLKTSIIKYLHKKNFQIYDYGTDSTTSVDYPKYAFYLGEKVAKGDIDFGIVICGTGIGISIACNKVRGVRCAKVDNVKEAKLTRLDNDANVLALNGSMSLYRAKDILDVFFSTNFSGLKKHVNRLNQIAEYENNNNPIKKKIKEEKERKEKEREEDADVIVENKSNHERKKQDE